MLLKRVPLSQFSTTAVTARSNPMKIFLNFPFEVLRMKSTSKSFQIKIPCSSRPKVHFN